MEEPIRNHEDDALLDELRDLLDSLAAGGLTSEQDARLQELAIESEAAWSFYLQRMFMYASIHREQYSRDEFQTSLTPLVDPSETEGEGNLPSNSIFPLLEMENDLLSPGSNVDKFGASIEPDLSDNNLGGGFWGRINFSFMPGFIMIIASTLILSVVVGLPIYWSTHDQKPGWSVVARITRTIDCHWAQGEGWLREGNFLEKDELLDLESGLAEVEFSSGARVILQGPIRFTVAGHNDSRIDYGQLAAVVPENAKGFTVRTPGMDVVDLGTEFGVVVSGLGKTDVHVFKGTVEAAVTESNQPKRVLLKENDAIQYSKKSGNIFHIPTCEKNFIRDLESDKGVTSKFKKVINASFEIPDIRKVPEYQSKYGCTQFRPILGWQVSDQDQEKSKVAMYQISPYTPLVEGSSVGPGATDGHQVVTISLGVKPSTAGTPRSNWIFQSLGVTAPSDIGKTLKLSVDAGPRNAYSNLPQGEGMVFAGFALGVTETQSGTGVGIPGSFVQREGEITQLHHLEASLPITIELVGQELFILLAASDNGTSETVDQYHFDNVQLSVEE